MVSERFLKQALSQKVTGFQDIADKLKHIGHADTETRRGYLWNNTPTQQPKIQEANAMLIRDVIRNREPYSTKATATVQEAAEFMAARNIGAVCVLDDGGKLLGVFSERDVLNRIVVPGRDPNKVSVGEVTSELRAVIRCDETPHQALERMEIIGTRHLPVVDGERWVGMLSIRDLLRVELGEQGDELKLLHEYIQH
jgi:CBS domain-containing protein